MKRLHQIKHGGPKAYWPVMRALTRRNQGFTIDEVAERCEVRARNTATCYVRACVRAGHVEVVGERPAPKGNQPFKVYAVKVTAPEAAPFERPDRQPRLGAVHQHLWTAMRGLPRFTTRELAACASTDDLAISATVAQEFCWKLRRAGYLQVLGKEGRWQVLRILPGKSSGPLPPAVTARGEVVERNLTASRRRSS